ncbi:MAG: T9SS type A sorting domain-containing protein [Bacteroidetes bacterium]|nr:T9SS type A sorting domain-containing protein [Bacteroidota bacterium]
MKKIVLQIFTLLVFVFGINSASAQSFTVDKDTVWYTVSGYASISDAVTNSTSSPIQINWKVTGHSLPSDWQSVMGICDNKNCYSSGVLSGSTYISDTFSNKCDFHIQCDFSSCAAGGPYFLVVQLTNASTTKNIVFAMRKYPTAVASINKENKAINLYPNPANEDLNVVFDASLNVKNVTITNLIGKVMQVYNVGGNSAKLNVSNLDAGIYFVNLADEHGRVAVKKFSVIK